MHGLRRTLNIVNRFTKSVAATVTRLNEGMLQTYGPTCVRVRFRLPLTRTVCYPAGALSGSRHVTALYKKYHYVDYLIIWPYIIHILLNATC